MQSIGKFSTFLRVAVCAAKWQSIKWWHLCRIFPSFSSKIVPGHSRSTVVFLFLFSLFGRYRLNIWLLLGSVSRANVSLFMYPPPFHPLIVFLIVSAKQQQAKCHLISATTTLTSSNLRMQYSLLQRKSILREISYTFGCSKRHLILHLLLLIFTAF